MPAQKHNGSKKTVTIDYRTVTKNSSDDHQNPP